jgi:hypothetical protein
MKGVFTRARQPKMAGHVLREFWVVGGLLAFFPDEGTGEGDCSYEGDEQNG